MSSNLGIFRTSASSLDYQSKCELFGDTPLGKSVRLLCQKKLFRTNQEKLNKF